MITLGDFHVHTNFCPHGTNDSMESYVVAAIEKELEYITFTEHAPLPLNFIDPTPNKDSAMHWDDVNRYLLEGQRLKEKYKNRIRINIGFEIDYIEGYELETIDFLDKYGDKIDDSILSVHMLKAPNDEYVCLDFSIEEFSRIIDVFGSIDLVYARYYQTVERALEADLGKYKPSRIGHITLIEKFSKVHQPSNRFETELTDLLKLIHKKKYELDINTAGLYKEYCQSVYPPIDLIEIANNLGVPLVPGSDSHTSDHIARGFEQLPTNFSYSIPKKIQEG